MIENSEILMQIILTMENAVEKIEEAYREKNTEELEIGKKELMKFQEELNKNLGENEKKK